MPNNPSRPRGRLLAGVAAVVAAVGGGLFLALDTKPTPAQTLEPTPPQLKYQPRKPIDSAGFSVVMAKLPPWPPTASLEQIAASYRKAGYGLLAVLDRNMADPFLPGRLRVQGQITRASLLNYEGEPG